MRAIAFLLLATALLPARSLAQEHADMHMGDMHAPPPMHASAPMSARDAAELARQIDAVRRATARYRDHAAAVRDGYRLFGGESPLMGEHWYRKDLVGRPLDLEHPSTLQYATIGGQKVLVGVAYTVYRRPGDPVPEGFAGSSDHWHTHDIVHLAETATEDRPFVHWLVERRIRQGKLGPDGRTLLTMVHAWIWQPNPDGMFAMQHRGLPYLRAGLPAAWAASGDTASAQGVELLVPTACRDEVARTAKLARTDAAQDRALTSACEQQAAQVRAAVARHDGAAETNAAARAWSGYLVARDRILRPDQLARLRRILGSAVEHDMMMMD
jgi:hypothetical protein